MPESSIDHLGGSCSIQLKYVRNHGQFIVQSSKWKLRGSGHRRLILTVFQGNVLAMSYKTVEVELENGRVHPAGAETLPAKAHALLTILSPQAAKSEAPAKSLGKAMRDLEVMGRGEFSDLSTNPRHMDDFGK
jgi:hypothetical protein